MRAHHYRKISVNPFLIASSRGPSSVESCRPIISYLCHTSTAPSSVYGAFRSTSMLMGPHTNAGKGRRRKVDFSTSPTLSSEIDAAKKEVEEWKWARDAISEYLVESTKSDLPPHFSLYVKAFFRTPNIWSVEGSRYAEQQRLQAEQRVRDAEQRVRDAQKQGLPPSDFKKLNFGVQKPLFSSGQCENTYVSPTERQEAFDKRAEQIFASTGPNSRQNTEALIYPGTNGVGKTRWSVDMTSKLKTQSHYLGMNCNYSLTRNEKNFLSNSEDKASAVESLVISRFYVSVMHSAESLKVCDLPRDYYPCYDPTELLDDDFWKKLDSEKYHVVVWDELQRMSDIVIPDDTCVGGARYTMRALRKIQLLAWKKGKKVVPLGTGTNCVVGVKDKTEGDNVLIDSPQMSFDEYCSVIDRAVLSSPGSEKGQRQKNSTLKVGYYPRLRQVLEKAITLETPSNVVELFEAAMSGADLEIAKVPVGFLDPVSLTKSCVLDDFVAMTTLLNELVAPHPALSFTSLSREIDPAVFEECGASLLSVCLRLASHEDVRVCEAIKNKNREWLVEACEDLDLEPGDAKDFSFAQSPAVPDDFLACNHPFNTTRHRDPKRELSVPFKEAIEKLVKKRRGIALFHCKGRAMLDVVVLRLKDDVLRIQFFDFKTKGESSKTKKKTKVADFDNYRKRLLTLAAKEFPLGRVEVAEKALIICSNDKLPVTDGNLKKIVVGKDLNLGRLTSMPAFQSLEAGSIVLHSHSKRAKLAANRKKKKAAVKKSAKKTTRKKK